MYTVYSTASGLWTFLLVIVDVVVDDVLVLVVLPFS